MGETLEVSGTVVSVHGNNNYVVELEVAGSVKELPCYCSGKLNRFRISILPGDKVTVVISGPTFDRGRIVFRGEKREVSSNQKKRPGRK